MRLGICAAPLDLPVGLDLSFDFLEGHVQNLLKPEKPDADFAAARAAAKLSPRPMIAANCLLPADLKVTGPSVDHTRLARYAEVAFERAKVIGITTIVFGSAGARQLPEGWSAVRGFEQYLEALKILAPIAKQHDIMIVVEPLNYGECNLVNTIDEGAEAVHRCNHPNVQLLVDIFHMLRNGEKADPITRHASIITHAHVAEDKDRAQPGINGDDFRPYLKALRLASRCQNLTIECVWQGEMRAAVGPTIALMRQQLEDAK
ncbi:MAG TPA: TIM barrel protein [Opitutaceae bacterium]|nr:TIM barrel protein [Opitutaceae bacterium]